MRYHHVEVDDYHLVCGGDIETVSHVLLLLFWFMSSVGWNPISSLMSWLTLVFIIGNTVAREEMVLILWSLWVARNDVVWQQTFSSPHAILSCARTTLDEWKQARRHSRVVLPVRQQATAIWKASKLGTFTCNVDVFVLDSGYYGLSMIVIDSYGLCCAGRLMLLPGSHDPLSLCSRDRSTWQESGE